MKLEFEALSIRQKYEIGEVVKTKIVFGNKVRDTRPIWVAATIDGYNSEDNTWNLEVLEPQKHRVSTEISFGNMSEISTPIELENLSLEKTSECINLKVLLGK